MTDSKKTNTYNIYRIGLWQESLMNLKRVSLISSIIVFMICITMNATNLRAINAPHTSTVLQQPQKFMARLIGSSQVPAKPAIAKGIFRIDLTPGGRVSNYTLNVTNISNVTLVHIHQGERGTNGPIIATLYKFANGNNKTRDGFLLKGRLFGKQFEGPLIGKNISDLIRLISQGQIYVNVHTKQHPQGEIRGQLFNITSRR
jgi:CHRD domain